MAQLTESKSSDSRVAVIETLWRCPGLSRVDLADLLNVDKSTLSRNTGRLIDAGMVEEISREQAGPRGGRRKVGLAVRGDWGVWLGLKLEPEGYRGVLVDFAGRNRGQFISQCNVNRHTIPEVLEQARNEAAVIARKLGPELQGAGLSIPGPVRPDAGIVERSRPLGIEHPMDLGLLGRKIMNLETRVDKDVNCGCLAETRFNGPADVPNFLYLLGEKRRNGLALGLGMVINGRLHRGDHGAGGEFLSVYRNQGRDQLAMDGSILSRIGDDPEVMFEVVRELAPQIALIANALDIDRLILGGLFQQVYDEVRPMFEKEITRRRTYPTLASPQITSARQGEDEVAYGAAVFFADNPVGHEYWRKT